MLKAVGCICLMFAILPAQAEIKNVELTDSQALLVARNMVNSGNFDKIKLSSRSPISSVSNIKRIVLGIFSSFRQ